MVTPDPHPRQASPQAWRRLRRSLTDSELRDVARDLAAELPGEVDPRRRVPRPRRDPLGSAVPGVSVEDYGTGDRTPARDEEARPMP